MDRGATATTPLTRDTTPYEKTSDKIPLRQNTSPKAIEPSLKKDFVVLLSQTYINVKDTAEL